MDAFDALNSDRPYRKAKDYDACFQEIELHGGSQFCPVVLEHFVNIRHLVPGALDKFGKKRLVT